MIAVFIKSASVKLKLRVKITTLIRHGPKC